MSLYPDVKSVGYLDPEIANEGIAADAEWQPEMTPPNIPSYAGIKSIKKYFPQFTGRPYQHKPFPAWLYHPTQKPKLVQTAEQANALGVQWRATTNEERAEFGVTHRWSSTGEWRARPYNTDFDPKNPGVGKNLVYGTMTPADAQSQMITSVVAAVMAQMAKVAPTTAPAADPEYVEFQAFKAWKALQSVDADPVAPELTEAPVEEIADEPEAEASNALLGSSEKEILIKIANDRGLKVDGRWSAERLRAELEKIGPP